MRRACMRVLEGGGNNETSCKENTYTKPLGIDLSPEALCEFYSDWVFGTSE
jgi:hypothetical protein